MLLLDLLRSIIVASWIAMLILTFVFLFNFFKTEDRKQILIIAILAGFVVFSNFLPSIRGGYDNNHDFTSISLLFSYRYGLFSYKEVAPIFPKIIIDLLSSRNLNAILTFNRILPLLSLLIFYAGLRKAGAGKTGSIAGTCLLFCNFQAMISASSLSTTSTAVFIFITAIASLLNAACKEKIETADIIWSFSSAILTAMTRIEQLPALVILAAFIIIARAKQKDPIFHKKKCIFLFVIGIVCLILCIIFQFSFNPQKLIYKSHPILNFNMHFIKENFAIILSKVPVNAFPEHISHAGLGAYALAAFLLAALFPKGFSWNRIPHIPAVIAILFSYFMFIYRWQDVYPLHFTRHRMFLMIPMSILAAFSVKTIIQLISNKLPKQKITATIAIFLMAIFYSSINIRTVYALNTSLRNNDIEWQILIDAQKSIKGKYNIIADNKHNKADFIDFYFMNLPTKTTAPILFYIDTDMITFSKEPNKYATNMTFVPFKTKKFYNRFHTTLKEESHDKILLSPGFYKEKKYDPSVNKIIMKGLICIKEENYHCAINKAIELEKLDISHDAHFFKFLAYTLGGNANGTDNEIKFFNECFLSMYNVQGLNIAKDNLRNKPKSIPKNIISSDPIIHLHAIWYTISRELHE